MHPACAGEARRPELALGMTARESEASAAAKALQESEYRYRNLFQAMAASFWELDFTGVGAMLRGLRAEGVKDYAAYMAARPDCVKAMMAATRVLDVNEQTVSLFGRGDKAELLGTLEPFWPEASYHVFAGSIIAAIAGQPSYVRECKLRALDGRVLDTLFTACFPPESVANGKLLVGVIDISERVAAQAKLEQVRAEFAHAARVAVLGELTASIAHEVNQPLAAIAANAGAGLRWLDRAEPDIAEVRALTQRIIADAERAGQIIARVRAMVGHRAPELTPLSLNGVIEEAVQFLRHELEAHDVSLTLDLEAGLPLVLADRTQVQQLIVNLAINAMQALAGCAERRIIVRSESGDGSVLLFVEDTGPGLKREHLPLLFESFFSTKREGMGIGLSICRSIVEALGGAISAENRSEGGARFKVALPAHHTSV